jgi:hypothetical protein
MQLKCYFKRRTWEGTTEKPVALNPTRIELFLWEQQTYIHILRNQFKTHQEYLIFGIRR